MNVTLKLLYIFQCRLSVFLYPFNLLQMELLCILLKNANQIDFIDSYHFLFGIVRLMRLQAWHFQSLSSLCDCRAVSKFQKIILIKLMNFSVCFSRKYLCLPQGEMLEISTGEELSLNQNCNS